MKKFWIEWLDGTLLGHVEAENAQQALNRACRMYGLTPNDIKVREAVA